MVRSYGGRAQQRGDGVSSTAGGSEGGFVWEAIWLADEDRVAADGMG